MVKNEDWTGNRGATFVCNGATGHSLGEREKNDYYATDGVAAKYLMEIEPNITNIWENAVGGGDLAEEFRKEGKLGIISDLIDRDYKPEGIPSSFGKDFFKMSKVWKGDIVTNPPYKYAAQWVEHSMELINDRHYLALFLKLTFLESKARKELFKKYPLKTLWVSSSRIKCAKNGDFKSYDSSATAYGWFVWQKGYNGDTVIKWFN